MRVDRDYQIANTTQIYAFERCDGDPHSDERVIINVSFNVNDPAEQQKFIERQVEKFKKIGTHAYQTKIFQSDMFGAIVYYLGGNNDG